MRPRLLYVVATATALRFPAWRRRGVYRNRPDMPPLDNIAREIGEAAPWTAPKWVWSFCWRLQKRLLPLLHRWDAAAPENTCVNLQVLWLKAIAGDDCAYELLPRRTRLCVARPLRRFYPRLHHQNVKLRATFLDAAARSELREDSALVVLGAGFDTRVSRLRPARGVEVDLDDVVTQKRGLAARLERFEPAELLACDLSGPDVPAVLAEAVAGQSHVVYVLEALLIYLDDAAAARLLRACAETRCETVSLVFADRLPGVKGVAEADAARVLADAGFGLVRFLPKPGLARHMGVARRRGDAS